MVRGLVALGCLFAARAASAQPIELDVDAECDLAPAVRATGTFVDVAVARVQITERALTATIVLDDGAGHTFGPRVLHAASCDELARSVAVVVAISARTVSSQWPASSRARSTSASARSPRTAPTIVTR